MDAERILLARIAAHPCRPLVIAMDGNSAAGKTTLAHSLAQQLHCDVIHMDDFFLPPALRTPQRLAEPGGNVHYERFLTEVLLPLRRGEPISYGVFDCGVMEVTHRRALTPGAVTIVEGAYSLHPSLAAYYDLKIFLRTTPDAQAERILRRNGAERQAVFLSKWIPLEQRYFDAFHIPDQCDLVLDV